MIEAATEGVLPQLPLLASVFTASLLGSLHCAGMCGPFVAVYAAAGRGSSSRASNAPLHLAYHLGRALTYGLVGALGGAIGSFVDWAGEAAGIAQVAAIASSCLLVLWGLSLIFPVLKMRTPWDGILGRRLVQLKRRPPVVRASVLGALTPLLPCGWFYAFAVTAAGTGSLARGATLMIVFWLGTVPALVGMGAVMSRLGQTLRGRLPVLTGMALIALGVFGVASRMGHPLELGPREAGSGARVPSEGEVRCH